MSLARNMSASFVDVATVHRATVTWWWSDRKLHDDAYQGRVEDAVSAAVHDAEKRYDVEEDTDLRCQFEGIALEGSCLESVTAAAADVAAVLTRFKDVRPLDI